MLLRVRELRKQKGWTQDELESRSGVDAAMISLIENGKRNPTVTTLKKLADALDVRITEVFVDG